MRRRLLASTLVVAIVSLILLGLPLAYLGGQLVHNQEHDRNQRAAQTIAAALNERAPATPGAARALLLRLAPPEKEVILQTPGQPDIVVGSRTQSRPLPPPATARKPRN